MSTSVADESIGVSNITAAESHLTPYLYVLTKLPSGKLCFSMMTKHCVLCIMYHVLCEAESSSFLELHQVQI
jgi:hypothetical protein